MPNISTTHHYNTRCIPCHERLQMSFISFTHTQRKILCNTRASIIQCIYIYVAVLMLSACIESSTVHACTSLYVYYMYNELNEIGGCWLMWLSMALVCCWNGIICGVVVVVVSVAMVTNSPRICVNARRDAHTHTPHTGRESRVSRASRRSFYIEKPRRLVQHICRYCFAVYGWQRVNGHTSIGAAAAATTLM